MSILPGCDVIDVLFVTFSHSFCLNVERSRFSRLWYVFSSHPAIVFFCFKTIIKMARNGVVFGPRQLLCCVGNYGKRNVYGRYLVDLQTSTSCVWFTSLMIWRKMTHYFSWRHLKCRRASSNSQLHRRLPDVGQTIRDVTAPACFSFPVGRPLSCLCDLVAGTSVSEQTGMRLNSDPSLNLFQFKFHLVTICKFKYRSIYVLYAL